MDLEFFFLVWRLTSEVLWPDAVVDPLPWD